MTSPALTPLVNVGNVVTGLAALYYQVYNPSSLPARPPDTLALGGAWPNPWVAIGATHEGVTLGFTRETGDVTIEEISNAIDVRTANAQLSLSTVLAEDTLETLTLAFGGGTITAVAATGSTWGYRDFTISNEMTNYSIGVEVRNKHGYPRRVVIPIVKSVSAIETAMRRIEKHMYAVTIRALSPLSECIFHDVTAAPTA